MGITSKITASWLKLFGRNSGVERPTLQEAAKSELVTGDEDAKGIGGHETPQIEMKRPYGRFTYDKDGKVNGAELIE